MFRLFVLLVVLSACSTSKDSSPLTMDCGQDVRPSQNIDAKALAEAPVSRQDAGGTDILADNQAAPERDSSPLDVGDTLPHQDLGGDAEQCPLPFTIPIEGNCVICGNLAFYCCRDGSCKDGATCKNGICNR